VKLENFLIRGQRLGLRGRILFERNATGEPDRGFILFLRSRLGRRNRRGGYNFFPRREVHHKLSGDRFQQFALMTKRYPMLVGGRSARFQQRISHARGLLLHGLERLPDHRRAHPHRAQVADFLDLQQVGERIRWGGNDQPRTLPVGQLARGEVKNSE
jgi:hypothetical protein